MAADVVQLHPEVEAILREVAAQPNSALLRVSRGREARILSEDRPVAEASNPSLSRAESHLVSVYREEVAFALRQAAWYRIANDPHQSHLVWRRVTTTWVTPVPSARAVAIAAANAAREAGYAVEQDAVALLEQLAGAQGVGSAAPEVLAAAAHRIVPSVRGRMLAGTAFTLRAQYSVARACFVDAIRSTSPGELQSVCWSNLAHVLDESGCPREASNAIRRAVDLLPENVPAQATRLWLAVRLMDRDEALAAVSALDDLARIEPTVLDEVLVRFANGRLSGLHPLSEEQRLLARSVTGQSDGSARRLLDELA